MNRQAPLRVSRLWAWVPLALLGAVGCNKPRDWDCGDAKTLFQIPDPKQGAGAAPFSIERPGGEVKLHVLEKYPDGIRLKADTNRGMIDWMVLGHIYRYTEIVYSPAEELLRNVDHPEDAVPMKMFWDGRSWHVRFGFRSRACSDLGSDDRFCELGKDMLFFAADMTCKHRRVELLDE